MLPSPPKVGPDVVCGPNEKLVFEDNALLVVGATLLCGLKPKSPPVDVWVEGVVPKVGGAAAVAGVDVEGVLPNEKAVLLVGRAVVAVLLVVAVDGTPNISPLRFAAGAELAKERPPVAEGVVVAAVPPPKENPPVEGVAVVVLLPKGKFVAVDVAGFAADWPPNENPPVEGAAVLELAAPKENPPKFKKKKINK